MTRTPGPGDYAAAAWRTYEQTPPGTREATAALYEWHGAMRDLLGATRQEAQRALAALDAFGGGIAHRTDGHGAMRDLLGSTS